MGPGPGRVYFGNPGGCTHHPRRQACMPARAHVDFITAPPPPPRPLQARGLGGEEPPEAPRPGPRRHLSPGQLKMRRSPAPSLWADRVTDGAGHLVGAQQGRVLCPSTESRMEGAAAAGTWGLGEPAFSALAHSGRPARAIALDTRAPSPRKPSQMPPGQPPLTAYGPHWPVPASQRPIRACPQLLPNKGLQSE